MKSLRISSCGYNLEAVSNLAPRAKPCTFQRVQVDVRDGLNRDMKSSWCSLQCTLEARREEGRRVARAAGFCGGSSSAAPAAMAKIKKAMKGGSKVTGGKKGKKPPESDQVLPTAPRLGRRSVEARDCAPPRRPVRPGRAVCSWCQSTAPPPPPSLSPRRNVSCGLRLSA